MAEHTLVPILSTIVSSNKHYLLAHKERLQELSNYLANDRTDPAERRGEAIAIALELNHIVESMRKMIHLAQDLLSEVEDGGDA